MLYLPISFSYLSHYHPILPPKPKTQIISLLISLKCYQLLPPNLRSDHLLPLPAQRTAKHCTIPAISPSSESISFLSPPTTHIQPIQPRNGAPCAVGLIKTHHAHHTHKFAYYLPVIPLNNCKSFENVTENWGTTISKWLTTTYNIASRSFGLSSTRVNMRNLLN